MSLPNIPVGCREPQRIAAGDNVSWTRLIDNYPSALWSLTYLIRSAKNQYQFNANANAGAFTVTLDTNVTANWAAGIYAVGAIVTSGGEQVQIKTSFPTLTVTANLLKPVNGVDPRSFAARTLESIEDTIAKLTQRTVDSAMVNGQSYTLANISELWKMRERFKSEVRREQARDRLNAGLGASNKIGVRFKPLNVQGYPPQIRVPWQ